MTIAVSFPSDFLEHGMKFEKRLIKLLLFGDNLQTWLFLFRFPFLIQGIFSGRTHFVGLFLAGRFLADYIILVENIIITDEILARRLVFQQKAEQKHKKIQKLLPVDDDYLLLDYYYYVVWGASCTKRVKRDYFYLDYSFLGSARLLILIGMRPNLSPLGQN